MKTISLRAFRVAVDRLTEPVQVVKREDGEIRTLGTWTPLTTEGFVWPVQEAGFGTSHPAPKPGKGTK